MALRIRVEVVNLLVAVALAKDADLSVVVPRAADLARVANRYLVPAKTITLVMGQEGDFDQPLTAFGTVETLQVAHD